MTDEQTKELLRSLSSISWHLKRIADAQEGKEPKTPIERIEEVANQNKIYEVLKRKN